MRFVKAAVQITQMFKCKTTLLLSLLKTVCNNRTADSEDRDTVMEVGVDLTDGH